MHTFFFELIKNSIFPTLVLNLNTNKIIFTSEKTIFDIPKYKKTDNKFFLTLKDDGWSLCPDGFAVFSKKCNHNPELLLILHGLKIKGLSTHQGKTEGLSIKTERDTITTYVNSLMISLALIHKEINKKVTESIHEIRSTNTAIYHVAFELQNKLINQGSLEALARTTVTLSELMSARITLIDALASDEVTENDNKKSIVIYKKFDKMIRCFTAYSKREKITIDLKGNSHSSILGNDLTDLIPLLLIDNAVKYAPKNSNVEIDFKEKDDEIFCSVSSFGPLLTKGENELIFQKGYRGENTRGVKNGNGIGLYFLKQLMKTHRGSINVEQQSNPTKSSGVSYYKTTFNLKFSTYNDLDNPPLLN